MKYLYTDGPKAPTEKQWGFLDVFFQHDRTLFWEIVEATPCVAKNGGLSMLSRWEMHIVLSNLIRRSPLPPMSTRLEAQP